VVNVKKLQQYKGFVIAENKKGDYPFLVFTKDEWSYGAGVRYPEWQADSVEEAREWIESE
jgi:hypothetical protein